jgi:hypothetical protein
VPLDRRGHIDDTAALVQWRFLVLALMRTVIIVMSRVFSEHPAQMLFTIDQQVIQALTP